MSNFFSFVTLGKSQVRKMFPKSRDRKTLAMTQVPYWGRYKKKKKKGVKSKKMLKG